jgi:hypothetical protein
VYFFAYQALVDGFQAYRVFLELQPHQ